MEPLTSRSVERRDGLLLSALSEAGLPVEDLGASPGQFFRFDRSGVPAGYGGFEVYEGGALLRSVVVLPAARNTGTGRLIVSALLAEMRGRGVLRAFLLTETAESFFRHLGFIQVPRETVPEAIRATPQAMTICASAAMLTRETL